MQLWQVERAERKTAALESDRDLQGLFPQLLSRHPQACPIFRARTTVSLYGRT